MSVSFEPLTASDVPVFKDLLKVFSGAFEDTAVYQGDVLGDAYLAALLGKDHFIALAAIEGGRVLGGLIAHVLDKFEQARSEVYIYDLAVQASHPRRGIATGLIFRLKPLARARGAWVIFVEADHGDMPAIQLYESLGAREDVYHFDIAVGE